MISSVDSAKLIAKIQHFLEYLQQVILEKEALSIALGEGKNQSKFEILIYQEILHEYHALFQEILHSD